MIINIDQQSVEIADSVHTDKKVEEIGAGDQGMMIGYATNETENFMPLSHFLASLIVKRLKEVMTDGTLPWVGPDGKSQITVEYLKKGNSIIPLRVHTVLISTSHEEGIDQETIIKAMREHVIPQCIPKKYLDEKTIYHINVSGSFTKAGPYADAGLTGRKIIVDTYGGWGSHGGGAFSGKDPTKVDRSGAYAARWVAKSLVANGFCERACVQIAYGIGIPSPISIYVDTYRTVKEGMTEAELVGIIRRNFDLRAGCIIKNLNLKRPFYKKLSSYGHFGWSDPDFLWEKVVDLKHEMK